MNISFRKLLKNFLSAFIKAFAVVLIIEGVADIGFQITSGHYPLNIVNLLFIFLGSLILFWNSSRN